MIGQERLRLDHAKTAGIYNPGNLAPVTMAMKWGTLSLEMGSFIIINYVANTYLLFPEGIGRFERDISWGLSVGFSYKIVFP